MDYRTRTDVPDVRGPGALVALAQRHERDAMRIADIARREKRKPGGRTVALALHGAASRSRDTSGEFWAAALEALLRRCEP